MTESVRKIVVHIEDEFNHWASLNEGIEAAILESLILIDEQTYDSFEYEEPENERESPAITEMSWVVNNVKHELVWVLNYDSDLTKLVEGGILTTTENNSTFFILDASQRAEHSEDPEKTLQENFDAISDFIHDTRKQVRVFSAYSDEILKGNWDVTVTPKINGLGQDPVRIENFPKPSIVISKTGPRGRNSELPGELKALLMDFILGVDYE